MNNQRLHGSQNGQTSSISGTPLEDRTTGKRRDSEGVTEELEAHAKTHAMLAAVLERLDSTGAGTTTPVPGARSNDWVTEFLSGKPSTLLGFVSNLGGAWTVVLPVAVALLNVLLMLPPLSSFLMVVPPLVALLLAGAAAPLAKRFIPRKPARTKFLCGVLVGYSGFTVLYLAWLSLGFLHQDKFANGVLFALSWFAVFSVLRQVAPQVREMSVLAREQESGQDR